MGIHPHRSTPQQELLGRIALVVLGVLIGFGAAALGWFCIAVIFALNDAGAARPVHFCWPLLVLSRFLELAAMSLIFFAFVPSEDARRHPPRGFIAAGRVFDGFWHAVRRLTKGL